MRRSPDPAASTGDRSLAECLQGRDVVPATMFALVTRFAMESRNAGQRPEEMLARLQAIHAAAMRTSDQSTLDAIASLWSVMTGHAIAAYLEPRTSRMLTP